MIYDKDCDEEYVKIPLGKTEFSELGEFRVFSLDQLIRAAVASRAVEEAEVEFAQAFRMTPVEVFKHFDSNESAPGYKSIIMPIAKRRFNLIYRKIVELPRRRVLESHKGSDSKDYSVTV